MSKYQASPGKASPSVTTQVIQRAHVTESGSEVWHVTSGGNFQTFTTTGSSAAAMDEALFKYAGALKRLAEK